MVTGAGTQSSRRWAKRFSVRAESFQGLDNSVKKFNLALKAQGLKARKIIAQGKASLRATPWVNRPQNFQALKGRQNFLTQRREGAKLKRKSGNWNCERLLLREMLPHALQPLRKPSGVGHAEKTSRPTQPDVKISLDQIGGFLSHLVNVGIEHRLELQPFDVLDRKDSHSR